MNYIIIFTMIIVGALAASNYLEQKVSQVKPALDFMMPYKGWIGLVSMAIGLFWLIRLMFYIGTLLRYNTVASLIFIFSLLLMVVLGILMAQEMIKKFMGSNEAVMKANSKVLTKFSSMQERLGLMCIIAGFVNLLLAIT